MGPDALKFFGLGFVFAVGVVMLAPASPKTASDPDKCDSFAYESNCAEARALGYRCSWDHGVARCLSQAQQQLLRAGAARGHAGETLATPAKVHAESIRLVGSPAGGGGGGGAQCSRRCHDKAACVAVAGHVSGVCTCGEGYVGDGTSFCGRQTQPGAAVEWGGTLDAPSQYQLQEALAGGAPGSAAEPEPKPEPDAAGTGHPVLPIEPTLWAPERAVCNGSHTKQGYPEKIRTFQMSPEAFKLNNDKLEHYAEYIAFVKQRADPAHNMVVLTVATDGYRRPLMNWLHAVVASGVSCYVVVALDEPLYKFLVDLGIPCYHGGTEIERAAHLFDLKWPKDRLKAIWALRYLLLRVALVSGVTVLQCDIDAILLRNPIPRLAATPGDVVGQRGTFPFRINLSWGATVVFGVIMYRPSAATLAWFDLALPRFYEVGDDQSEFQRSLDACTLVVWNHGHTWPASRLLHRSLKPKPKSNKTDYGVTLHPVGNQGTRLNLTLLPTNEFPRKCGPGSGSPEAGAACLIAHCVSPKGSGAQKIQSNAKRNMSFLQSNWHLESPQPGEDPDAFILRIGTGSHPSMHLRRQPMPKAKPKPKRDDDAPVVPV